MFESEREHRRPRAAAAQSSPRRRPRASVHPRRRADDARAERVRAARPRGEHRDRVAVLPVPGGPWMSVSRRAIAAPYARAAGALSSAAAPAAAAPARPAPPRRRAQRGHARVGRAGLARRVGRDERSGDLAAATAAPPLLLLWFLRYGRPRARARAAAAAGPAGRGRERDVPRGRERALERDAVHELVNAPAAPCETSRDVVADERLGPRGCVR